MMMKNTINPLKALAMLTLAFGLIFITSCGDEDEEPAPTQNIVEIVTSTDGLDSLAKYLSVYPDLVGLLSGEGDFTVFAPTNDAFVGLLQTPGFPSDLASINPLIIKNVLAYHVSTMRYEASDLSAGVSVATASEGNEAIVVNSDGTLFTGSSNAEIVVLEANIKATNGVIHTVGSVLIPPSVGATLTPILGTNAGTLLLGADFSVLAQAIAKAETFAGTGALVSILAGTTKHTVFAPTNGTFYQLGGVTATDDDAAIATKMAGVLALYTAEQWYGIIANHVVLEDVAPGAISNGLSKPTALGNGAALTFYIIPDAGNFTDIFIDSNGDFDGTAATFNAEVALPDAAVASNGRVHVIAGVLAP